MTCILCDQSKNLIKGFYESCDGKPEPEEYLNSTKPFQDEVGGYFYWFCETHADEYVGDVL